MNEEQQRHVDFLRACVEYFERVVAEKEDSQARLSNKIEEAQAELDAMGLALTAGEAELAQANTDAENAQAELDAYLEELDSGGQNQEPEDNPVAGTGVGANDATIRTEES